MKLKLLKRVTIREKALFTRSLSAMISAGLPLVKALTLMARQTTNDYFAEVLFDVIHRLEEGESLSSAISHHPKVFDKVYISSIKGAEVSGKFEEILGYLAEQQESEYKLSSAIKGAIAYPVFIVCAMIVASAILLVVVVPKLKTVFDEANVALPIATRMLLAVAGFLISYWYLILIVLVAIIIWIRYFLRTESGQALYGRFLVTFPLLKEFFISVYMARFCRTFGMLAKSGVPIVESVGIVGDVLNNVLYKNVLAKVANQLQRGVPMSTPLSETKIFPPLVSQMVAVGEQTGKLDEVMMSLARFFDEETNKRVGMITSLLEPVLLVIVGLGVGIIVFSIIMPIYQISQTLQ